MMMMMIMVMMIIICVYLFRPGCFYIYGTESTSHH